MQLTPNHCKICRFEQISLPLCNNVQNGRKKEPGNPREKPGNWREKPGNWRTPVCMFFYCWSKSIWSQDWKKITRLSFPIVFVPKRCLRDFKVGLGPVQPSKLAFNSQVTCQCPWVPLAMMMSRRWRGNLPNWRSVLGGGGKLNPKFKLQSIYSRTFWMWTTPFKSNRKLGLLPTYWGADYIEHARFTWNIMKLCPKSKRLIFFFWNNTYSGKIVGC